MPVNNNSIVYLNIHGLDYRFIIPGTRKCEVINLLRNADFSKNSGSL